MPRAASAAPAPRRRHARPADAVWLAVVAVNAVLAVALSFVLVPWLVLLVVRRTRLRGQPWALVAVTVTVAVAGPLSVFLTPGLW